MDANDAIAKERLVEMDAYLVYYLEREQNKPELEQDPTLIDFNLDCLQLVRQEQQRRAAQRDVQTAIDGLSQLSYISPQWWGVAEKAINVIRSLSQSPQTDGCDWCNNPDISLEIIMTKTLSNGRKWIDHVGANNCPHCGRKLDKIREWYSRTYICSYRACQEFKAIMDGDAE
jgi:hypothetical protein